MLNLRSTCCATMKARASTGVHEMASFGMGFAILPELYIRSDVGGKTAIDVPVPQGWKSTRSIAAAWRSGAAYGDAYRTTADRVQAEARLLIGIRCSLASQ